MRTGSPLCSIIPPHILRSIAERGDDEDRERAHVALEASSLARGERAAATLLAGTIVVVPQAKKLRIVYDARKRRDLPGRRVRAEGAGRVADDAVNEAYDGCGRTFDYFKRVHGRTSVDDRGMRIESTVHYGNAFNNAQWNGRLMICGDGDGKYFRRFTSALDVIAHELTHGLTQYTARLGYSGQSGALNEHFSDVFGTLVRQYTLKQTAARADWLVGGELLTSRVAGDAIRSMKAPGTAYDDPIIGRDPQPMHMRNYVKMDSDAGGVHVNSGIPNHAFYRLATMLGGKSWEVAGRIWYDALTRRLGPRARFQQCADATWLAAGELYGTGGEPQEAVLAAWRAVGIAVTGPRLRIRSGRTRESFATPSAGAEPPLLLQG